MHDGAGVQGGVALTPSGSWRGCRGGPERRPADARGRFAADAVMHSRAATSCILEALFMEETSGQSRPRHALGFSHDVPRRARF